MTVPRACEQLLQQAEPFSKGGSLKEPRKGTQLPVEVVAAVSVLAPSGTREALLKGQLCARLLRG